MTDKNIENLVDDYQNNRISRRSFVKAAVALVGVAAAETLLASCQPNATTPTETAAEESASADEFVAVPVSSPVDEMQINWLDCTKYKKDPPWTIAYPAQGATNSWALMGNWHVEYAVWEKYKGLFSDYYYADSGGNAAQQISDMESILVKEPDIIIGGALGAAGKAIFDRAFDMGIPLVIGQLPYESDKWTSFVNPDNYIIGAKFADWVAKKLQGKGKIVMTSGIAGTDTAELRLEAAYDVFSNYPGIEILAHDYMDWSISEAKKGFEAWIAAFPEIDAVWSDSAFMSWGAIEAFVEANRDVPPMTAEPLNGFLKLAKQYDVEFFCKGYPASYILDTIAMCVSILNGEVVPKYVDVPGMEFDTSQLDDFLKPDMSDDLWVDYRFPAEYIDKMFAE